MFLYAIERLILMKKMSKVDLALSISRVLSNYQKGRTQGRKSARSRDKDVDLNA